MAGEMWEYKLDHALRETKILNLVVFADSQQVESK